MRTLRGPALEPYERRTLAATFFGAVDRFGPAPALRWREGDAWRELSYQEAADHVARIAAWLHGRGVGPGDRVGLLSENRVEWTLTDYAVLTLGAVTVPVYASLPADQAAYILGDAGVRGVVVSSAAQAAKIRNAMRSEGLTGVEWLAAMEPAADAVAWNEVMGSPPLADLRRLAAAVRPRDLASIVYSSGTTGAPKGVMLTHANLAYMVAATGQSGCVPVTRGDTCISILPLAHVLERAADFFFWDEGVTITFARGVETLAEDLLAARPHVMVSVPRLFEKLHDRVVRGPGARGRLGRWARDVAARVRAAEREGRRVTVADRARLAVADRTVFATLRRRTGGRLRGSISGGAPLSAAVGDFFFAAGLPIYEGYGLTETSPVLTGNHPEAVRIGTVGRPYPGVEIRIAESGEILAKSPGVMVGYWDDPDATGEVIDEEGWFHTGDVGEIDDEGFLRITDRLKDLIVTAGGKNIAPQAVENRITSSPYIAQAVMIGDRRAFPVLLVVPDWEALSPWAERHGVDLSNRAAATRDPRLLDLLHDETADRVRDLARFETPKRFSLLPDEFTVDAGLLTPSLKTRRRAIEQAFHEAIERLYAEVGHLRDEVMNLRARRD